MAAARGWADGEEWADLDKRGTRQSNWDPNAVNKSSGAYGIPQANPSGGAGHPYALGDIPAQVKWGLDYIDGRYGDPLNAWGHSQRTGWYGMGGLHGGPATLTTGVLDQGGWIMPGQPQLERHRHPRASPRARGRHGDHRHRRRTSWGHWGERRKSPRETARQVREQLLDLAHDLPGNDIFIGASPKASTTSMSLRG